MANDKVKAAKVSRKPQFKGANHPVDIPKAWRGSGNRLLVSSALEHQRTGRGYCACGKDRIND